MATPQFTAAERLFIVPKAHTALLDTRFQVEMYELFHRTAIGRIGHMVGTPAILLGVFIALQLASGGPFVGLAVLAAIAAFALRVDRLVALVTALLGLGLVGASAALIPSLSAPVWTVAALVFGGCLVQTLSHVAEEIPPPHSGTDRFVPALDWLRKITVREVVRSTVMLFGVFYWLEMWATFRIWPLQILHVLLALGYRPELRRALDERSAAIVAEPASDWRSPHSTRAHA